MFTQLARVTQPRKRSLRGRCMVAVDMENVWGGAILQMSHARGARRCVERFAGLAGNEHVVVGISHVGMLACGLAWPAGRLVVRSGENGADLALLEVLERERIAARFDRVVLASGDGIFTDVTAALGVAGVHVTILSRPEACSRRLRVAAAETRYLDPAELTIGDVA